MKGKMFPDYQPSELLHYSSIGWLTVLSYRALRLAGWSSWKLAYRW